jgi:hypothetical protein
MYVYFFVNFEEYRYNKSKHTAENSGDIEYIPNQVVMLEHIHFPKQPVPVVIYIVASQKGQKPRACIRGIDTYIHKIFGEKKERNLQSHLLLIYIKVEYENQRHQYLHYRSTESINELSEYPEYSMPRFMYKQGKMIQNKDEIAPVDNKE